MAIETLLYLQIRNFILKTQKSLKPPNLTALGKIVLNRQPNRGLMSCFYTTIRDSSKVSSEDKRRTWSEDLNNETSAEDWQKACLKAQKQSINSHFKLIQYKWLMRTYVPPALLNKFNPSTPDVCFKCQKYIVHCPLSMVMPSNTSLLDRRTQYAFLHIGSEGTKGP